VQARFLLGPAGSGKTFRCVEEVRSELLRSPDGPPLIFLAPKQATFQIERQLLGGQSLRGYSRLQILSFERLAAFVFERLGVPLPDTLSEEGRIMVLRALLARHHAELRIFRASARLTGFAGQLSNVLRELQRHRVSVGALSKLASQTKGQGRLPDKLHDLGLLLDRYEQWLVERREQGARLQDSNCLLDLATEALRRIRLEGGSPMIGGLWLDGFAEMTPQETALMAAVVPHCQRATLAFCLDGEPPGEFAWLSPWAVIGRTFAQCHAAVAQSTEARPIIEVLSRNDQRGRFFDAPGLRQLERAWAAGPERGSSYGATSPSVPNPEPNQNAASIRLVSCPHPEAEARLAAREILRHVQAGGRYRDCAILVRSLDGYHDVLRRVLGQFDIPFFLDRREPVAHHPLAELTRYALRTAAFDWRQEDWFGALKTGLAGALEGEVDWLENESLKRGWAGEAWRRAVTIPEDAALAERLEAIRRRVMPPFERLAAGLNQPDPGVSGGALGAALRHLWSDLRIESQLQDWMETADRLGLPGAAHATVWNQLEDWLENLELAFAHTSLAFREWLPIVEAGLSGMTVGVIPPSIDQVLVGSVDRSRNPDLQTVFVLGVNEGVFPAPPQPAILLTDSERLELLALGVSLGATQRQQLGHERYFGYIAFTRPRRRLVVSWAEDDGDGTGLNPSTFVDAIRRAVPDVREEAYVEPDWPQALHRSELSQHVLAACVVARETAASQVRQEDATGLLQPDSEVMADERSGLIDLPEFAAMIRRWRQTLVALSATRLSSEVAARLYGRELRSSVSALEDFVACPFRFVASKALRTAERDEFVVDARQKGSFQHELLQRFHERARTGGRFWRDLTPAEARQWVREIGDALAQTFEGGLMVADDTRRFVTGILLDNLAQLMGTLVEWAPNYGFDPTEVEASFGLDGAQLPAWSIPLARDRALQLRGRIDRIDLARDPDGGAGVVICDYKSSGKEMDRVKIEAGLELQLLSYLAALTRMPAARAWLGASTLRPAGVFYVPLRAKIGSDASRGNAAETAAQAATGFQHRGRFDGALLARFDRSGATKGVQFRFKVNQNGELSKSGNDALPPGDFARMVDGAEETLRTVAERIFSGEAGVEPYRLKQQTACDWCAYRSVCRFDPWTMSFRPLGRQGRDEA